MEKDFTLRTQKNTPKLISLEFSSLGSTHPLQLFSFAISPLEFSKEVEGNLDSIHKCCMELH